MKLLTFRDCLERYGAENHMLRVAVGVARRGMEVHAAFPSTEGTASMIRACGLGSVHYHPFNRNVPFRGGSRPARFLRLKRLLNAVRPDVVQLTVAWPSHAPDLVVPFALERVPTLVVFQCAPQPLVLSALQLRVGAWARTRRQRWAAVSQQNLSALQQTFRARKDELDLLYNGVEIEPDKESSDGAETDAVRRAVRCELGLPQESRLLLTVSRLVSDKGHADLLQVAPGLVEKHPDVRFVWAGDGPERESLTSLIRQLRLESRVRVLGYRSDIDRLRRASDLLVHPSYLEGGCSSSIREAMVHRLPIVSSNAGGIPEVLRDGQHALLFDAGNCEQMRSRVCEALSSPAIMRKLADQARTRIEEFSSERMVEDYIAVFEALCHPAA